MWVSLFIILHVSVITQTGDSALMRACAAWRGHTETVAELVKAKANLDLQNYVRIQLVMMSMYTTAYPCGYSTLWTLFGCVHVQ